MSRQGHEPHVESMSAAKLLLGPPKPPPRWPLYAGVGLVWLASVVGALGLGKQMGRADTEQCLSKETADRLLTSATEAARTILLVKAWTDGAVEYADTMMPRVIVAQVDE